MVLVFSTLLDFFLFTPLYFSFCPSFIRAILSTLTPLVFAPIKMVSEEKTKKEEELSKMKEESAALAEAKQKAELAVEELKKQAETLDAEKMKLKDSTSQLQGDIEVSRYLVVYLHYSLPFPPHSLSCFSLSFPSPPLLLS